VSDDLKDMIRKICTKIDDNIRTIFTSIKDIQLKQETMETSLWNLKEEVKTAKL
jgi:hypothetical protein